MRHVAWPSVLLAIVGGCSSRQTESVHSTVSQRPSSPTIQTVGYQAPSPEVEQVGLALSRGTVVGERPDFNDKPIPIHDWKKESVATIGVGAPAPAYGTLGTVQFPSPGNVTSLNTAPRGQVAVQGSVDVLPVNVGARVTGTPDSYPNQAQEVIQASPWLRTIDAAVLETKTLDGKDRPRP